jgi:hypothetical protein
MFTAALVFRDHKPYIVLYNIHNVYICSFWNNNNVKKKKTVYLQ